MTDGRKRRGRHRRSAGGPGWTRRQRLRPAGSCGRPGPPAQCGIGRSVKTEGVVHDLVEDSLRHCPLGRVVRQRPGNSAAGVIARPQPGGQHDKSVPTSNAPPKLPSSRSRWPRPHGRDANHDLRTVRVAHCWSWSGEPPIARARSRQAARAATGHTLRQRGARQCGPWPAGSGCPTSTVVRHTGRAVLARRGMG